MRSCVVVARPNASDRPVTNRSGPVSSSSTNNQTQWRERARILQIHETLKDEEGRRHQQAIRGCNGKEELAGRFFEKGMGEVGTKE